VKPDELGLRGYALAGAKALAWKFPSVVFTSGRRSLEAQAHAMAVNVAAAGRTWITRTYKDSEACRACQAWIDANATAVAVAEIAVGLLGVLRQLGDKALEISRHLTGDAFDVQPVAGVLGPEIEDFIRTLPELDLFMTHEGGLSRWHCQFVAPQGAGA
jgi:hypothetical protein